MQTDFPHSNTLESANEAYFFCKVYLEEKGQADAAAYLEGMDFIDDVRTGREARGRLVAAARRVSDSSSRHVVTLAINAVERVLGVPVLLAAS